MESFNAVTGFTLRRIEASDLHTAALLHKQGFPDTLNSRLGAVHLARLYDAMRNDPNSMVQIACKDQTIIGVVSATGDSAEFKRKFKAQLTFSAKSKLAMQLLFRPALLLEFFRQHDAPVRYHSRIISGCLTAIAVDVASRQTGVGTALVRSVEEYFLHRGMDAFHLFTRADNRVSREFYKRLGFVEVEQRGKDIVLVKEMK